MQKVITIIGTEGEVKNSEHPIYNKAAVLNLVEGLLDEGYSYSLVLKFAKGRD